MNQSKFTPKIIAFLAIYTLAFFLIRQSHYFLLYTDKLIEDLSGVSWLYTVIGSIFGIFAAFTIQKEWELWNQLVDSVKHEVDALHELWLWTQHFPNVEGKLFENIIKEYIQNVIEHGWNNLRHGQQYPEEETVLKKLHDLVYHSYKDNTQVYQSTFTLFSNVLRHRNNRIERTQRHMPRIIKATLLYATTLVIGLSMLIWVQSVILDYIFTTSIAILCFIIYLVVDDLDNPLRPGGWHVSTKDYQDLLQTINNHQHNQE